MRFICVGLMAFVVLISIAASLDSPSRHVDPFIGTDEMGHTFPGVWLDGVRLERNFVTHEEIVRSGELRFVMSDRPDGQRGTGPQAMPYSMSR